MMRSVRGAGRARPRSTRLRLREFDSATLCWSHLLAAINDVERTRQSPVCLSGAARSFPNWQTSRLGAYKQMNPLARGKNFSASLVSRFESDRYFPKDDFGLALDLIGETLTYPGQRLFICFDGGFLGFEEGD